MDSFRDVFPPFTNQGLRARPAVHLVFPQDMLLDIRPASKIRETL